MYMEYSVSTKLVYMICKLFVNNKQFVVNGCDMVTEAVLYQHNGNQSLIQITKTNRLVILLLLKQSQ